MCTCEVHEKVEIGLAKRAKAAKWNSRRNRSLDHLWRFYERSGSHRTDHTSSIRAVLRVSLKLYGSERHVVMKAGMRLNFEGFVNRTNVLELHSSF